MMCEPNECVVSMSAVQTLRRRSVYTLPDCYLTHTSTHVTFCAGTSSIPTHTRWLKFCAQIRVLFVTATRNEPTTQVKDVSPLRGRDDLVVRVDASRLFADPVFLCFFTGSEHLIWTYSESREHRLGASRSLLFWVMGSTTIANDWVKLYNFKFVAYT